MARQILNSKPELNTSINTNTPRTQLQRSGISSDRDLLKKRSAKFVKTMMQIDHGTLASTIGVADLVEKLKEEFGALGIIEYPLGVVSKCYLGAPYEVHILDLTGDMIIEHFKAGNNLPGELERARGLAMNASYAFVEVYPNKMILVKEDGTTTKL